MPLYEYRCEECVTRFEQRRSMADADNVAVCPVCASLLTTRVISAAVWMGAARQNNGRFPPPVEKHIAQAADVVYQYENDS